MVAVRRQEALDRLKRMEPDLRRQGLSALYLFGSVARDEAGEGSDVDLAFRVPKEVPFSLFDQAGILHDLIDHLGTRVDFVPMDAFKPRFRARVEADLVRVF